ncbi:hypothetical protein M885DRAFT_531241 [Pelagophyceae sp. CCMP2097]|nr:hypothetical protein M885DRAFT_531241 [Pelagophyceae sp. CCMP2097]
MKRRRDAPPAFRTLTSPIVQMLAREVMCGAALRRSYAISPPPPLRQCDEFFQKKESIVGTGFFALRVDYSAADVVALSRVRAGRAIFLSQLEFDLVLRLPCGSKLGKDDDAAFALEALVGGRRWRLDVAVSDILDISLVRVARASDTSFAAEARYECPNCGRRCGASSHYDAHRRGPCSQATSDAQGHWAEDLWSEHVSVLRVVFRAAGPRPWAHEAAVLPSAGAPTWRGAPADWGAARGAGDPLRGELERTRHLTARFRHESESSAIAAFVDATRGAIAAKHFRRPGADRAADQAADDARQAAVDARGTRPAAAAARARAPPAEVPAQDWAPDAPPQRPPATIVIDDDEPMADDARMTADDARMAADDTRVRAEEARMAADDDDDVQIVDAPAPASEPRGEPEAEPTEAQRAAAAEDEAEADADAAAEDAEAHDDIHSMDARSMAPGDAAAAAIAAIEAADNDDDEAADDEAAGDNHAAADEGADDAAAADDNGADDDDAEDDDSDEPPAAVVETSD